MVKQRVTSVDICLLVAEIQRRCVGYRLANLYDVTPKLYLLKFAKPDSKELLVVESGVRLHCTAYARNKPVIPSSFTLKLRKHLRTWRLESVQQLGLDRIVDLTFGVDENAHHLILEFYAKGNIILTDNTYNIIAILRTHKQEEGAKYAVREHYPVEEAVQHTPMSAERLMSLFSESKGDSIKQLLNSKTEYGPSLIEHCLLEAQIKPNTHINESYAKDHPEQFGKLTDALKRIDEYLLDVSDNVKGYIYKNLEIDAKTKAEPGELVNTAHYEHFSPIPLKQYESSRYETISFPSFNAAVDEYFAKFEGERTEAEIVTKKTEKLSKVEKVRRDHEERIAALQKAQLSAERCAELILSNVADVDQAIAVVRSALASSIDWQELKRIIKEQRKMGNPVAHLISDLKLEQNKITLLLSDSTDDASEEALTAPALQVDVDIGMSAHANARHFFTEKRGFAVKEQKTKSATDLAVKSAQKRAESEIKAEQPAVTGGVKAIRKPIWFEKFHWFISSENYLVLAGKDAQQNEILVKRHLRPGDVYLHADLHGAPSCVVKNASSSSQPIPLMTLQQAGTMCVCRSSAWDKNIVTSAWWVFHNQVSKTAPTGEYLTTGSFMIRGKKNYLPPTPLVMGLAILFRVADENIPDHLTERRPALTSGEGEAVGLENQPSTEELQPLKSAEEDCQDEGEGEMVSMKENASREPGENEGEQGEDSEELGDTEKEETQHHHEEQQQAENEALHKSSGYEHLQEEGEEQEEEAKEQDLKASEEADPIEQKALLSPTESNGSPLSPSAGYVPLSPAPGIGSDGTNVAASSSSSSSSSSAGAVLAKYDLPQHQFDPTLDAEETPNQAARSGKKRLSAKERKLLKRGQTSGKGDDEATPPVAASPEEGEEDDDNGDQKSESSSSRSSSPDERKPNGGKSGGAGQKKGLPAPSQPMCRKAKAKQKKIQAKYKDQDEEERELRMMLLGHKPKPKVSEQEGEEEERGGGKKQSQKATGKGKGKSADGSSGKTSNEQGKYQKLSPPQKQEAGGGPSKDKRGQTSGGKGLQEATETGDAKENRNPATTHEDEVRDVLKEEGIGYMNEEDRKEFNLTELDALVGQPTATDTLLHAVPVCAPYSALTNYKYRIKLVPGLVKRGKAVQSAQQHFLDLKEGTAAEKHVIRNIENTELLLVMLGSVRLAAPGLAGSGDKSDGKGKQKKKK